MTDAGRARPRTCAGCGTVTAARWTDEELAGSARVGPVRATVDGSAPSRCRDCGAARADHQRLTDAVRTSIAERLVSGVGHVGVPRCGACGTGLDLPMRATTRGLTVVNGNDVPFTVTVALPLVRCGGCSLDNVPPELSESVERATLTACGVPPAPDGRGGPLRWLRRRVGRGSRGRPSRP